MAASGATFTRWCAMPKVHVITQADVDAALLAAECGESGVDDANLLRAYIAQLKAEIEQLRQACANYEYGEDGVML